MCEPNRMQVASCLLSDMTGRDKIMRTCSFTAGFLASFAGVESAKKLRTVQGQISSCRVVFRLFGDLPMWLRARRAKWGKASVVAETPSNPFTETVSVLNVAADLLYSPVEHIAWAAQNGLIPVSAGKWWTGAIAVWAASLFLAIYKSLSNLSALKRKMQCLRNQEDDTSRDEYRKLSRQAVNEQLNVLRCSADLMCAVNSLPEGFLWSRRLSARGHCMFGMISSLSGLLQVKRDLYPGTRL